VKTKRILIVDDDRIIRLLYQKELIAEGYEVDTAASALDALEMIRTRRPDLVILDIRMQGLDGLEAIGRILAIDRELPVVFNTAYASYKDNFLSWLADAFVEKSSDLQPLKQTIHTLLTDPNARNRQKNAPSP
jgi:CheY-like chemotaxis protein